jgi:orotidine-5'-phosphate decarboxylase
LGGGCIHVLQLYCENNQLGAFFMPPAAFAPAVSERIFVALDFDDAAQAVRLVQQLGEHALAYKVGLQLLTAQGPGLVRELVAADKQVFLDLKLFEIPSSVAAAVAAAGRLGVSCVTVHASAGSAVLKAAVLAARPFAQLRVLALTVITSMDEAALAEVGVAGGMQDQVTRLAGLALAAGCHGVVASPQEARLLPALLPVGMLIVTPGVQLQADAASDHVRQSSPLQAMQAGATHVVMGRAIAGAHDPLAAFKAACTQVARALDTPKECPQP